MVLGDYFASTLGAARTGAPWAWESLYRDLAGAVLGYMRGRGAPEPEDLVSETFLHVARDIHRFTGDEQAFRAWVFTIARRRLQDAWRRAGREVAVAERDSAAAEAERTWLGDTETEALTAMSLLEVNALIRHLTIAQRDVLLLRVVGDLSVAETAQVLETSEGAVRQLQRRAIADLRKSLPSPASQNHDRER